MVPNEFGDAYVRGIVAGGELYGLIEFGTGTDEEQQAIAASLDTVCGTFGDGADLAAALEKSWALREGRTRVTVYQQGGAPRPTPAAAELIDRVLCFGDAVPGRGVAPYSVLLGGYGQLSPLAGAPGRPGTRPPRAESSGPDPRRDPDPAGGHRLLHLARGAVQPISGAARTAIEEAHRTLARQLDDVTRAASRCASTARGCVSTVDYPGYGLPDRRGVLTMPRPTFARPIVARPVVARPVVARPVVAGPIVAGPEGRPAATGFAHAGRLLPAGAATS